MKLLLRVVLALALVANADAFTCTTPTSVTATEYATITETSLDSDTFAVTLVCATGYTSSGTPTAVACGANGPYTVTTPCIVDADCVETTAATSTCTEFGEQLYTKTSDATGGGEACTGSSTTCAGGDGSVPADVDCVDATAATSTCTTYGQELYTLTTAKVSGGADCTGSSTLCSVGHGSVPGWCADATALAAAATTPCTAKLCTSDTDPYTGCQSVDCVESTAATSTCTTVGQELYTETTAPLGPDAAACTGSSTTCAAGDGTIPDADGKCGANFKVSSGACVACASGKEVAAGGDTTGDDTTCTIPTAAADSGAASTAASVCGAAVAAAAAAAAMM